MPDIARTAPKRREIALALLIVALSSSVVAGPVSAPAQLDLHPAIPATITAAPADEDGIPEITVHGSRDPLADGDARLKRLQDSLPCADCGTTQEHSLVLDLLGAAVRGLLPAEAPQHERDPLARAVDDSRDGICAPDHMQGCSREQLP